MKKTLAILSIIIVSGCASQKGVTSGNTARGDTRTKNIELLDDNTYLLLEPSEDKTYAFDKSNPVKVGGSNERSGPKNERRFLNALSGPNGEAVKYFRAGSCCPFKTPNGIIDNTGMLDTYRVFWDGGKDTVNIYINMYDKGDLKIPVGFTARKKN
jgi:hypothetical protein